MKKSFLFSALLAALLLTGCSESAETAMQQPQPSGGATAVRGETPVGFVAYADRSVTRGGLTGELTLPQLQLPSAAVGGGGFGVFAYYTDLKKYDQTYIPNFMYNQKVEYSGGQWTYSPLLYWPNEYGSSAQSDDEDKVSFFAYAPYVEATSPAAGSVENAEWGITGFSRNTSSGDPIVKYIASFDPSKSVDLCWGVCDENSWAKIEGNGSQQMSLGLPWLNVEHPKGIDQKLKFTFKHALAKLNVQIDADADVAVHDESDASAIAAETKVYVRSISFTGIALQGALNLNNQKANEATWLDYSGSTDLPYGQSVTVKDGRRDGREGTTGAEANNELPKGLNSQIVQSTTWDDANATPGVTNKLQNLFQPQTIIDGNSSQEQIAAALAEPVYVIPTGEAMTVTIVYDIETASDNLSSYLSDGATHGVSIENRITKSISFGTAGEGLTSGKTYTLKLHLGMNSVKFDAAVSGWGNGGSGNADLPSITGVGIYNANNPLGFQNAAGTALAETGPSATERTITGLGDANIVTLQSANGTMLNTWTSSDQSVAQIAAATAIIPPAGTRAGSRASTRAETVWSNRVANSAAIQIKPLKAGTTTITAVNGQGEKATCVITVNAPDINIVNPKMTLYKFASDSPVGRLNAEIVQALDREQGAADDTWATPQAWEVTAAALADGTDKTATPDEVLTIAKFAENDTTFLITPVAAGTATVKLKTTAGAEKTFTVSILEPSITLSATEVSLRGGSDPTKVVLSATTVPADLKVVFTNTPGDPANYTFTAMDADKKATVAAVKDASENGSGTVTVTVDGHADLFAECAVTVACADPGVALYDAETGAPAAGIAVKRIICSDVAKSYASAAEAELWGHRPIAVIVAAGIDDGVDTYDTDNAVDGVQPYKNLALALQDANGGSTCQWFTESSGKCVVTQSSDPNTIRAALDGIAMTKRLATSDGSEEPTCSGHVHRAAQVALDYEVPIGNAIGANSGWFLPSSGQWNLALASGLVDGVSQVPVYTAVGLEELKAANLNPILKGLGVGEVKAAYWSSTEWSATGVAGVGFSTGRLRPDSKLNSGCVRAVLAF